MPHTLAHRITSRGQNVRPRNPSGPGVLGTGLTGQPSPFTSIVENARADPSLGPGGVPDQPFPNISSGEVPIDIQQLNPAVFGGLEQLRRQGLFGETGISRFQQLSERASAERRRRIATGLRRSFGRRGLRGRSGAFTTALANASRGENEAMIESLQRLFTINEQSKLGGLQGLMQLLLSKGGESDRARLTRQGAEVDALRGGDGGLLDFLPIIPAIGAVEDLFSRDSGKGRRQD